jgi:hypothetical protein
MMPNVRVIIYKIEHQFLYLITLSDCAVMMSKTRSPILVQLGYRTINTSLIGLRVWLVLGSNQF